MAGLHSAEDIVMRDAPIVPIFEQTIVSCTQKYVKGVHRSSLGYTFFNNAYIEK